MKIAVFGANGPTVRHLTRLALDGNNDVVAFTRHPDAFPEGPSAEHYGPLQSEEAIGHAREVLGFVRAQMA